MRLNKYLATSGLCSRREADHLIATGQVLVNGTVATLGVQVGETDRVEVNGESVRRPSETTFQYALYNKPIGVICSYDPAAQMSLRTELTLPTRMFAVGRLDVASSGLLLLTNDGRVTNALLRPSQAHKKTYLVEVDREISDEDLRTLAHGVELEDGPTLPAQTVRRGPRRFDLTLTEGRNRQIRRMCEAVGYGVTLLHRTQIMHLNDLTIPSGSWRFLTEAERRELLKRLALT